MYRLHVIPTVSISKTQQMKTPSILILGLILTIFAACYPLQNPQVQNAQTKPAIGNPFKGDYTQYVDPSEKVMDEWYHYVVTKDISGQYIYRTFFPETSTMTSEVTYLGSKMTTKHGPYAKWHDNGHKSQEGIYQDDLEVGEWLYYHRKTGELSSAGVYDHGDKIGIWNWYDEEGRLSSQYKYEEGQREGNFTIYDSLSNIVNRGEYRSDTLYSQSKTVEAPSKSGETFKVVEQMPYLASCKHIENDEERSACSNKTLLMHIYKNLRYPAIAREYGVEGMTITQFTINEDGSMSDVETVVGICQSMKDETERVVNTIPLWEAGMQGGKKVKVQYTLPTRFRLE